MAHEIHAGIEALGLAFPETIRTNDDIRRAHPERVARARTGALARAFSQQPTDDPALRRWAAAMQPYADDPFLGAEERRILAPGQTAVDLEVEAVNKTLDAAGIGLDEVDLILVNSMFPDHPEEGDAAWLARALGYRGAAWSINNMCASGVVGLQMASALIEAGLYRRVLVVVCCTYSRNFDPASTVSFIVGDGAAACLVSARSDERVLGGWGVVNAAETCGLVHNRLIVDESGEPTLRTFVTRGFSDHAPRLFARYLTSTVGMAVDEAGWPIESLDGAVFFTPTRWFDDFARSMLASSDLTTLCAYAVYGQISSVSIFANLYHAAATGLFAPGDRLALYSHGFAGSGAALAMRWQPFALGAPPALGDARPTIHRRSTHVTDSPCAGEGD